MPLSHGIPFAVLCLILWIWNSHHSTFIDTLKITAEKFVELSKSMERMLAEQRAFSEQLARLTELARTMLIEQREIGDAIEKLSEPGRGVSEVSEAAVRDLIEGAQ